MPLNNIYLKVLCCVFILFSAPVKASISIIELYGNPDVKIAFISNSMNADCFLMKSDFTGGRIKASIVHYTLADKLVMLITNTMNKDDPSCLLR
jgi:hypothetical protein